MHSERQAEGCRPPDNGPGPRDWQVVPASLTLALGWPCPPTGSTQSGVWRTLQPHLLQPRAGRRCTGLSRGPDTTRVPAVCFSPRGGYSRYEGHRMQPQAPPCPRSHKQHTLQAKDRGCRLLRIRQDTHTHTHPFPFTSLQAEPPKREAGWVGTQGLRVDRLPVGPQEHPPRVVGSMSESPCQAVTISGFLSKSAKFFQTLMAPSSWGEEKGD